MKRTAFKCTPKPMKRRSGKVKQPKSATGPMLDPIHKAGVKSLPCAACGAPGPSDIHHCKDRPPADVDVYRYFPGYGEVSADYDGIPLCRGCHDMYHRRKGDFRALWGNEASKLPHAHLDRYRNASAQNWLKTYGHKAPDAMYAKFGATVLPYLPQQTTAAE